MTIAAAATPPRGGARRDDDAIFRAVLEQVIPDWYYSYDGDDGKKGWGIGTTGASEYARIRGQMGFPIRFHPAGISVEEKTMDGEKGAAATVIARDVISDVEGIGYVFRPHYIGTGADRKRDPFNNRTAVSEAKRNAIFDLIPEVHQRALLKVRTTVAERNWQRFEAQRKEAQRARLAAAPRIRAVTGAEDNARALADDPYELSKTEPDPAPAETNSPHAADQPSPANAGTVHSTVTPSDRSHAESATLKPSAK